MVISGGGGDCRPGHWGDKPCRLCGWRPDQDNILPEPTYLDEPDDQDDVREQKAIMRNLLGTERKEARG